MGNCSIAWEVRQKARGWGVSNFNYVLLDIVYFDGDCDYSYVKNTLINHDGFPSDILLREYRRGRVNFNCTIS